MGAPDDLTATQGGQRKPRRRVTVKDVAREAGVSVATVSRAISGDSTIAGDTRERVLQMAEQLGYRPNLLARGLITRRSGIIAVFANNITNPFYPEVMVKLTRRLQEQQLHTMLVTSEENQEVEHAFPALQQFSPDVAVILAATMTSGSVERLQENRIPVILFNRYVAGTAASAVCCDNYEGGRLIARRLAAAGHRRLAFIEGLRTASTSVDRLRGFTDGCAETGLDAPLIRSGGDFNYETGYDGIKELYAAHGRIDAVFCANDIVAIGAMDAARRELGLSIPEDLSVVGFDDIAMASWPSHDLTTVRQPMTEMIECVASEITRILKSKTPETQQHFLPGRLIVRGSARLSGEEAE